jgi:hypothetical protein
LSWSEGALGRPRDLAEDPQAWPHADLVRHPAAAVQRIAATLAGILAERRMSLRGLAAASGVSRHRPPAA